MKQYTSVTEFLKDLDSNTLEQVQMLREIISQNIRVDEHIKWNSPSYLYEGEDRITFSVREGVVKVIIHMGAKRKEDKSAAPILVDKSGIIKWNSDIRGTINFENKEDILIKRLDFVHILKAWLDIPH